MKDKSLSSPPSFETSPSGGVERRPDAGPELYRAASRLARQGDGTASWSCARAGLALCRTVGDAAGETAFCLALGRLAWSRGLPEAALRLFDEGLAVARRSRDRLGKLHLLSGRVAPLAALGRRRDALASCREALPLTLGPGPKVRNLAVQAALCALPGTPRAFDEAERRCRLAYALATRTGAPLDAEVDLLWRVFRVLGNSRSLARMLPELAESILEVRGTWAGSDALMEERSAFPRSRPHATAVN